MKKLIILFFAFLFSTAANSEPLKVGIMAGPNEKLFKFAGKIAKEKYNLTIKAVVFTDYQFPNEALNNGDIDANFFQTKEFLDSSLSAKNYKIEAVADTFVYPMGIYSKKLKSLKTVKAKSVIVIPTGASNQSRALVLLENAGLITLKKNDQKFFTPRDIQQNDKKFKILAINGPQIPRYVIDADIVVLNNDFVISAGFKFHDSLFDENSDSKPYINVVAAQTNSKKSTEIKTLIQVLHSAEYEQETYKYYSNAVKAWK